jgi:hypothetical protein
MTFRIFVLISFLYPFFARAQHWEKVGLNQASIVDLYTDYSNNELFICGGFLQTPDSLVLKGIAKYHNGIISNLGTGFLGNPTTNCAGKINGQLYAGGWADPAINRSIAKFNPITETWTPLINAPWGAVRGFKQIDNLLHFYGSFDYADSGATSQYVGVIMDDTCYNSPWLDPYTQSFSSIVMDIEKFQNKLFLGGSFTVNGNKRVLCYYDNTGVYQVGQWNSANDHVGSLEIWQNKLIIGGYFPGNSSCPDISLLAYDGTTLYPLLTDNPFLVVYSLASYGSLLFIAGYHIDSASSEVQVFDGTHLTSLTNYQLNNGIRDMEILDDSLYIAGFFQNCFPPENISGVAKYSVPVSQLTGLKKTENISDGNISFYPNPCNENISIQGIEIPFHFEIKNLQGQIVAEGHSKSNQMDTSQLLPGCYVLTLSNKVGTHTAKIMKVNN